MRLAAALLVLALVAGCTAKDPPAPPAAGPGQVSVTAEVVQFTPDGVHGYHSYVGGGSFTFDVTVLRIIGPGEWRDRTFGVLGNRQPAAPAAFHTVGTRWTFLMSEDRVRAMVADPDTGTSHQVFETGLEGLTQIH